MKILFLCIFGIYSVIGMEVYTPTNIAGNYKSYGIFWGKSPKEFNITGVVVLGSPVDGCSKFKNQNDIAGNIVLIDKDDCYPQEKMKHAQDAGAIGCIIRSYQFHGQLNYVYDGGKHNNLNIASVEIAMDDYLTIKKAIDDNVTVSIMPDDNPFDWFYSAGVWVPWMVIFIPWNAGLIILGGIRYCEFVKLYGFETSVTQLSLILLMLSRVPPLLWSFDPQSWLQLYPDWFSTICSSAFFPYILGAYLMIAFYWYQLSSKIQQFSMVLPKLDKMKIPFIIIFVIILGLEMGTWVPRALNIDTTAIITLIVVYFTIALLAASIFYFIQAYKILQVFQMNAEKQISSKSRNLKKVTILVIITGACYTTAALLTGGLGVSLDGPETILALYYTVYPLFAAGVTAQILIFNPKGSKGTSSSPENSAGTKKLGTTEDKDVSITDNDEL